MSPNYLFFWKRLRRISLKIFKCLVDVIYDAIWSWTFFVERCLIIDSISLLLIGLVWCLRQVWVMMSLGSWAQQLSPSSWHGFCARAGCSGSACRGSPFSRVWSTSPCVSCRFCHAHMSTQSPFTLSLTQTLPHCCPASLTPSSLIFILFNFKK